MGLQRISQKTYLFLTILCLVAIFSLQQPNHPSTLLQKEIQINIDKEKVATGPAAVLIGLIAILYLSLLVTGIGNLIIFAIKKIQKKPLTNISCPLKEFPLSGEKAAKLIFLIVFFILIIFAAGYILPFKDKPFLLNVSIFANLILQTGIALLILKFISVKYLGLDINKYHIYFLLRLYTAILPLALGSLLLNSFILEKAGVKPSFNPAMELIFLLKNKGVLLILFVEVTLLGPLVEELFFRGFIYKLMRERFSFTISAIAISVFFSLLHRASLNVLPLFTISFALCYLYEKTQSILSPIIFHAIHNSLNLFLLLVMKNPF